MNAATQQDFGQPEKPIQDARNEVFRLFGHCVLRFQSYEILMKDILAQHQLSGSFAGVHEALAAQREPTASKTLGALVADMLGSVLVPAGAEGLRGVPVDARADFAIKFQIVLGAEEFARIEAAQRELVELRNGIVHHFLVQHDLSSLDGCSVAQAALTRAMGRIVAGYAELLGFARDINRHREAWFARLALSDVAEIMPARPKPSKPMAIVPELRAAAAELAQGEWTLLDAAISRIKARHPDAAPKLYQCKSWRQVVHESKLFDLQLREVNGRRQACYRPRQAVPAGPKAV